ncbi:hypothetical protein D1872_237190 [compost metagenome]
MFDLFNTQHADIFKTLHVGQVTLSKCHEKADTLEPFDMFDETLHLFMIEQITIFGTDLRIVPHHLDRHGFGLYPLSVFPVAPLGTHFAQIDFGIEVGGERVTVIAGVAVENIDRMDLVEVVLLGVGAKDIGDARIKSASQKCHDTGIFVAVMISPLLFVFELCRIGMLVICRIEVVYACL